MFFVVRIELDSETDGPVGRMAWFSGATRSADGVEMANWNDDPSEATEFESKDDALRVVAGLVEPEAVVGITEGVI